MNLRVRLFILIWTLTGYVLSSQRKFGNLTASLSPIYKGGKNPASNLVDGKIETFARTSGSANGVWLRVYLASVGQIEAVKINNRRDCCWDRIIGMNVLLKNGDVVVKDCGKLRGSMMLSWTLNDCQGYADTVEISNYGYTDEQNVAEVEVYGPDSCTIRVENSKQDNQKVHFSTMTEIECNEGWRVEEDRSSVWCSQYAVVLDDDLPTCININECEATGGNPCGPNANCTDTQGSYNCTCWSGFFGHGDGSVCTDYNECDVAPIPCHEDANCINTPGSYECHCRAGFDGDGTNCSRSADVIIQPSVQCRDDRMVVDMGLSDDHTVESYFLNNGTGPGCSPPNTTEIIDIPLDGCGTTTLHNATHLVFQNKITVETVGGMESAVVNRDGLIEYEVDCAYPRTGLSAGEEEDGVYVMVSWTVGKTEFMLSDDSTLNFTFAGFTDETYKTQITAAAADEELLVRQRMYYQFGVDLSENMNSRLELVIVDVVAQDDDDPTSDTKMKYKIVDNGCVKDKTYRVESPANQTDAQKSFSMEAFTFIHDKDAKVYLHGVLKLCDKDSDDYEACKHVCKMQAQRKKRSAEYRDYFRAFTVTGRAL